MSNEILPTIAVEIQRHHQCAQALAENTRQCAEDALTHAVQAGRYIEQAQGITKGQTLAWLRDNVPDLTPQRAKAYLSLFHTAEARTESIVDHRQLILLGVIDQKEITAAPKDQTRKAGQWIDWTCRIAAHFRELEKEQPIREWHYERRQSVAAQLKPIVELYRALGGQVP